jgi:hypothetical protein
MMDKKVTQTRATRGKNIRKVLKAANEKGQFFMVNRIDKKCGLNKKG